MSLVARFWRTPYRGDLVRWGTQLHDKFMLPFHVWHDFVDVIDDMNRAGLSARRELVRASLRVPLSAVRQRALRRRRDRAAPGARAVARARRGRRGRRHGSLRRLVARAHAGARARLQRATLCHRVQRLAGAADEPRAPPASTSAACATARGNPRRACSPTIPVDAPLTFDLYDRWSGRAVAGCTYHVAHPGGRNFERFPVNAYEAESRRLARFFPFGHTPGAGPEPRSLTRPELPHTLDLRWSH